jgi:hypothetical protein
MTVLISDVDCGDGGFSPPYLGESGPTAVVSLAATMAGTPDNILRFELTVPV